MEISALNASAVKSAPDRKGHVARWLVLLFFLIAGGIGTAESLAQKYHPERSLLSRLHDHGYLTSVPVAYEPSKGVWFYAGWAGAAMMVLMLLYSVRKRVALLRPLGRLPQWLSIHMFLGIMGPLFITFHTTFKFGGLIATSYYCMIITMVSGLLGRYLYIQIPRSISGTELLTNDIDKMIEDFDRTLSRFPGRLDFSILADEIGRNASRIATMNPASSLLFMIRDDMANFFLITRLRKSLRTDHGAGEEAEEIISLLKNKAALVRRKAFLATSHKLLHYWHVFHLPLAIVMFLIMFLHISVYYIFRPAP